MPKLRSDASAAILRGNNFRRQIPGVAFPGVRGHRAAVNYAQKILDKDFKVAALVSRNVQPYSVMP